MGTITRMNVVISSYEVDEVSQGKSWMKWRCSEVGEVSR
jgi:hypothetical protein